MLYSLPTGKVIELSTEQYLELTDEELEYLISINYGEHIENPFFGSFMTKPNILDHDEITFIHDHLDNSLLDVDDISIDYTPEED